MVLILSRKLFYQHLSHSPFAFQIYVIVMDPYSLSDISADPRSGIRSVIKRVTVVLSSSTDIKENLIQLLNQNLNQYFPDIGGILLGYTNVRYSKVNFDWSQGDSDEIVTLKVLAKFFLFNPAIGSTLRCTVRNRTPTRINCLAQSHFPVTVYNPDATWDSVGSSDVVQVEVQVVSQMAKVNPIIIGVIRSNGSIVQDVISVDDIDTEEDVESESLATEAVMQDGMTTISSVDNSQTSAKKRKHSEELSSSKDESHSQGRKKFKSGVQPDNPLDGHTSSTSGEEVASLPSNETNKPVSLSSPTKKLQNSTKSTDPSSTTLDSQDPMANKETVNPSSKKILSKILPRPKSSSSDSDLHKSESGEAVNNSKSTSNSSMEMDVDKKRTGSSSSTASTDETKVKKRNAIPEGFKDISSTISRAKKIEAPNGEIFKTYKACWDFVKKNPDYLTWKTDKDEVVTDEKNSKAETEGDQDRTVGEVKTAKLNEEGETASSTKKESGEESDSDSSFEDAPVKIPSKERSDDDKVQKNAKEPNVQTNVSSTSSKDNSNANIVPPAKKSISKTVSQHKDEEAKESSSESSSSSSEDEQEKSDSKNASTSKEPASQKPKSDSDASKKKADENSSSDSSSDEEEEDKPVAKKASTPKVPASPKPKSASEVIKKKADENSSSDSSSDEEEENKPITKKASHLSSKSSDEEEENKPVAKKASHLTKIPVKPKGVSPNKNASAPKEPASQKPKSASDVSKKKADENSSSDSSSDEEEEKKPVAKRASHLNKSPARPEGVSPKKTYQAKKFKNAVFQSSSESESEDEEEAVKKDKKGSVKPNQQVNGKENGKEDESSYVEDSDGDTGFEDDKKKLSEKNKVESSSSSSDSDSDEESSIEEKKKTEPLKKDENKGKEGKDNKELETGKKSKKPSTPPKRQLPSTAKASPSLITKYLSKTPKKSEKTAPKRRENLIDKVLTKKADTSPQLSSTVAGNFNAKGKKKVELPEGISPILKKSKSLSSKADKSVGGYFDKIIKTSKVGSDDTQPLPSSSKVGDNSEKPGKKVKSKDKKKNKKVVAGFL